ncbi:MAG: hypothetical protein DI551_11745 [Micavibrio aeruginosavorus]|uniref:Transmembrane protein n=1 Tax=Micavibrio aeruginosavorus TaxID=349221 RepID=A0A2W5MT76_9BACT|nr:MAG: hypothetical protein DI551_11745 [Micavibrio aeruginosavorus]
MADISDNSHMVMDTESPDTPYEGTTCKLTLICALAFLASGVYYFLTPPDDGLKLMVVIVSAGALGLSLVNFFAAAFTGKLCGCKKE